MKKKTLIAFALVLIFGINYVYSLQNQLGNAVAICLGKNVNIQITISNGSENLKQLFSYCRPINKLSKNDSYMIFTALNEYQPEPGEVYSINWNYYSEYCIYQYVIVIRIDSVTKDEGCKYTWWNSGVWSLKPLY